MNYFGLVNRILDIAGSHDYVFETYYGDIYEFENSGNRKYANVVLTPTQSVDSGDYTTYTFTLFSTDRLTDDKSNKVAVQSHCKSILTGILDKLCETGDVTLSSATFYYWTEKFNDLCGGCYVTFTVALSREEICVDDVLPVIAKKITSNGLYDVRNVDEVEVYIPPTPLQVKSVTVTKNDATVEVSPDDGYALERVDVTTAIVPIVKGIRHLSTEYVGALPYIFDFSGLTTTNQFASYCSKLTGIGGIINTGSVKNMGYMFNGCSKLATLDVSEWDTGSVTNMYEMFNGCSSLATLDVSKWDTGSVTTMYGMFNGCSSLATLDVSEWDTGSVTNMYGMFWGCSSLATLDVSGWDTSRVTNMYGMFYGCSSLATLDVGNLDTGSVTNMYGMFSGCSSLKGINGIGELNTSSCINMDYCFAFTALTELDLHKWDVSNVTRMSRFLRSSAIERVDMHGWDVKSLTIMESAFQGSSNLKWLDMTDWTDCSNFLPSYEFHFNNHNILTLIGDHTLAEVEAGEVSLYKNLGKINGTLKWASWQFAWTYASMLAMCQGLYDRTGLTANTISLPKTTFNNCYNDDGSVPGADIIAARQVTIRAILAAKNYTLSIY